MFKIVDDMDTAKKSKPIPPWQETNNTWYKTDIWTSDTDRHMNALQTLA